MRLADSSRFHRFFAASYNCGRHKLAPTKGKDIALEAGSMLIAQSRRSASLLMQAQYASCARSGPVATRSFVYMQSAGLGISFIPIDNNRH